MMSNRWAGTPSSSYLYEPSPVGAAASATIFTISEPYLSLSSLSTVMNDVPANDDSSPSTRSSSVGWPHDSCICSATCDESSTIVLTPGGHCGASSSATASVAIRSALTGKSHRLTSSYPSEAHCPPDAGYWRVC